MIEVQEVLEGETERAADAMLALRPRWKTATELTRVIDDHLGPSELERRSIGGAGDHPPVPPTRGVAVTSDNVGGAGRDRPGVDVMT